MPGDHDWPEIGARSGPTSAVDGEICHTEGDGPCHSVVKPAPFTRRRVMASSPWGSWVAVEACAPGTIRVFRGVPAETADGTTAYAPITDRHGRELFLDARPEPAGETKPEAHVLAMEIMPHDPEEYFEGRSETGAAVVVMTAEELKLFAIRRVNDSIPKEYFECTKSAQNGGLSHELFLGPDRGRLIGLASDDQNVAVVASRVVLVMFRVDLFDGSIPEEVMHTGHLTNSRGVFRPDLKNGPVVNCAFLDSETRTKTFPGTVAVAIGFEKEIRVVRFLDGDTPRTGEGCVGYEVLKRVLVDAPGPVRSIAAHGGWIFASTEKKTALPSTFRDGAFTRDPVNFAFAKEARFAGDLKKASPETAELGDDGRDAPETPFLRARLDDKTKRLQDMVQPFLPAELRGIEPAEVPEVSEDLSQAERGDEVAATLQAFAFERLPGKFEAFVSTRLSLPLAPTLRRPEICALQSNPEGCDDELFSVALTDVGASTGAETIAVAEIVRESEKKDWRLVPRGTSKLPSKSDTKTKTRVDAFGRIARRGFRAGENDFGFDVTLLTSCETKDSETPVSAAGFQIFGGGSKKKPAPPASLFTFRVSLDVTRRSRTVSAGDGPTSAQNDGAPTAIAPSENVTTTTKHPPPNPPPRLEPPRSDPPGRATDFDRVLDAIRALDSAVHDRFDRVEATLQIQERRLRRVEESLRK